MELWHGSQQVVESPSLTRCRPHNDYGPGFYCTRHVKLAREWACPVLHDGFANHYRLDDEGLRTLDLSEPRHRILTWLALLLENRVVDLSNPVAREGRAFLLERCLIDTSGFDLIRGPRADDSYFSFARAFLNNTISVSQLARAMRLGELGEQVALVSERSFGRLEFVEAEPVSCVPYYALRTRRDHEARRRHANIADGFDREGIYLRDLVTGGVGLDDARLHQ